MPAARTVELRSARRPQDIPLWMLYPVFFAAIFLSHLTLLRLPYFWDEGGYYIPAAWDLFRTGTLIPQSTVTIRHYRRSCSPAGGISPVSRLLEPGRWCAWSALQPCWGSIASPAT